MSILVGRQAPDFKAAAVLGSGEITADYTLSGALKGKYGLVFFYPLDFTFVCPSELVALNNRLSNFKERGVEVIAISIDSQFTHAAWRLTPINKGGIGPVQFPIVAYLKHEITRDYGVEHPAGVAMRATFLIDKEGVVQSQTVNNLPLGRNIDDHVRLVEALQFHEAHGEVCPAGWKKGDAGMKATTAGVAEYLANNAEKL